MDELDDIESVGIETLRLIIEPETRAIDRGRSLIQQVRQQVPDPRQRDEILKLIETILIYKLPRMSRREIEAMFSLSDIKQTRVYQEALEEGREEGREKRDLASGLDIEQVRQIIHSEEDRSDV